MIKMIKISIVQVLALLKPRSEKERHFDWSLYRDAHDKWQSPKVTHITPAVTIEAILR